jgi:hypothetical protein
MDVADQRQASWPGEILEASVRDGGRAVEPTQGSEVDP